MLASEWLVRPASYSTERAIKGLLDCELTHWECNKCLEVIRSVPKEDFADCVTDLISEPEQRAEYFLIELRRSDVHASAQMDRKAVHDLRHKIWLNCVPSECKDTEDDLSGYPDPPGYPGCKYVGRMSSAASLSASRGRCPRIAGPWKPSKKAFDSKASLRRRHLEKSMAKHNTAIDKQKLKISGLRSKLRIGELELRQMEIESELEQAKAQRRKILSTVSRRHKT